MTLSLDQSRDVSHEFAPELQRRADFERARAGEKLIVEVKGTTTLVT
jgi:hypothetical protein